MFSMTRPQAKELARVISENAGKAAAVHVEPITSEVLKGSVAVTFKGAGSKGDLDFIITLEGQSANLQRGVNQPKVA